MKQEVFSEPSADLSRENKQRIMKLRLNQLAATIQTAVLENRNEHLDTHGDDTHGVPIPSIIGALSAVSADG